jgi:hypothetical protein
MRDAFDARKYIDPFMLCFAVGVSTAHLSYEEAHLALEKYLESFNQLREYYEQGAGDA